MRKYKTLFKVDYDGLNYKLVRYRESHCTVDHSQNIHLLIAMIKDEVKENERQERRERKRLEKSSAILNNRRVK